MVELRNSAHSIKPEPLDLGKQIAEVTRQLKERGVIEDREAEDLFHSTIIPLLTAYGIHTTKTETHLKAPDAGEFDIVAVGDSQLVVMKVGNELDEEELHDFFTRLPHFREGFWMYEHLKVYGAVGSLVISEALEKQAERMGLFVFTQTPDGGAAILNPPDFRARFF